MGSYVSGIYRGDANIWFSGNWAAGNAESRLTATSSSISIWARVHEFRADTGTVISSTSWACDYRSAANHPVSSPNVSQYSGCAVVSFPGGKVASMIAHHIFGGVTGTSTNEVFYGCLV